MQNEWVICVQNVLYLVSDGYCTCTCLDTWIKTTHGALSTALVYLQQITVQFLIHSTCTCRCHTNVRALQTRQEYYPFQYMGFLIIFMWHLNNQSVFGRSAGQHSLQMSSLVKNISLLFFSLQILDKRLLSISIWRPAKRVFVSYTYFKLCASDEALRVHAGSIALASQDWGVGDGKQWSSADQT